LLAFDAAFAKLLWPIAFVAIETMGIRPPWLPANSKPCDRNAKDQGSRSAGLGTRRSHFNVRRHGARRWSHSNDAVDAKVTECPGRVQHLFVVSTVRFLFCFGFILTGCIDCSLL